MPRRKTGTVKMTLQQILRRQKRLSAAVGSSSPASSESSSSVASYPMPFTTSSSVLGPTTSGSNVTCSGQPTVSCRPADVQNLCAGSKTSMMM